MKLNPIIAGNWKMFKTGKEAVEFISVFAPKVKNSSVDIYIAPPFTAIYQAAAAAKGSSILIGAQNMHAEQEGAYTGEISAGMIKAAGAEFVILGHSERRQHFHETDEGVNLKVKSALKAGLIVILCVGEMQSEHDQGLTEEVLRRQIEGGLKDITAEEAASLVIAYEPVWAIGTGKTATPELAESAHAFIRKLLTEQYGEKLASQISILYGGSVKPELTPDLMEMPNINGALVGGASLKIETFAAIVAGATK
jgi:triosephosphate isomerase (TIM)